MLPNFRKNETEPTKSQPSLGSIEPQPAPFAPRAAAPAPRADERRATSIIGVDLTVKGNLISKGEVQVDGAIEGDIHGSHVVIGQTAEVRGNVLAEEVVVRGHVIGAIRSKRVMLQSTSQVEGDIFHQSLSIEQGAMFEGKSRRSQNDPRDEIAKAPPPPRAPAPPRQPAAAAPPAPPLPN